MSNFYVYYRVDPARLEEVRGTVERLFEAVARESGVRGRWMRRRDDDSTYMEIYEGVRDDADLAGLIARTAAGLRFEALLAADTARHIECFVPVGPAG